MSRKSGEKQSARARIIERISQAADDPSSVSFDGVSVSNRPIGDLIKADEYAAKQEAARSPTLGIRIGRFIPPGHR